MPNSRRIKNRRVLVTGGAGFIGSNLCADLVEDNEVICLDNLITGNKDNLEPILHHANFRFIEGDIRDTETCKEVMYGVDVVLHQAALGSVPRSINNPTLTNSVNIDGFLNVLNEAVKADVKRFVYAASSSTYGDHPGLPKREEVIGRPMSPYAVTKYVNELYAEVFSRLHGIQTIGLRYFNVFGRHQDPNGAYAAAIPNFVKSFIQHRSPVIHGNGEQSRDFTYIDNVIQANHLAGALPLDKEGYSEVFNVAYGSSITVNELTDHIKQLLMVYDPDIALVDVIHGPERRGDVRHSLADITKIIEHLGYDPTHSLQEGLVEAIEWYWNQFKTERYV
jgi:UDP-N-acetylglucosamine 4-epimerase